MSEYTSPAKKVAAGLPLWVMTFADLMTLLMCFFVLILSFSELDILKYKQLAGSMAHAFGVQRDIEAKDPPKGINIIAREFSPGQPQPTLMNVVRQKTVSDLRIHLEVGGHKTRPSPAPRVPDSETRDEVTLKVGKLADGQGGAEAGQQLSQAEIQELEQLREEKAAIEQEREALRQREEELRAREEQAGVLLDDATAEEIIAAREARERALQQEENARKILSELEEQILSGAVDVERDGQKIIIRIREKASFASGSAEVVAKFRPVLWRLGEIIEGMEGRIVVAGHTDPIPINTPRFRSNWELSSGRAVSVVHELLWQTAIPLERFLVQGHGETQPIAPNDTAANRAQNRRVEIILMQGDDREAEQEISRQGVGPRPVEEAVSQPEIAPAPEVVTATPEEVTEALPADTAVLQLEVPATLPEAVVAENPAAPVAEAPATAAMASEETPQAVPATDDGAGAPRPAVPERVTGSGVTAGAVRPPRPPAVTGQQEAP
jgi:chemotaxis protein MotB